MAPDSNFRSFGASGPPAENKIVIYVTHLHETSLMSRFVHVEFNIALCRVQFVLQIGENQKSILFFYPKLWNFENSRNIKS